MSGYWATGIARYAKAPAIVVTIAMTIARRGRSTKIAENIASAPVGRRRQRRRLHRHVAAHSLDPLDDHLFAAGQALLHDDAGPARTGGLDPADRRLAVARR